MLFVLEILSCHQPSHADPHSDKSDSSQSAIDKPYIYFIGNSVTYVFDIPGRLDKLMKAYSTYPAGYNGVASLTLGSHELENYLSYRNRNNFIILPMLKKPPYIVLQEQSSGIHWNRTDKVISYYMGVAAEINAEIVLYQTWHSEDHIDEYEELASKNNLSLSPIAKIWKEINRLRPDVILAPDHIHQNELGASIIACAFFYTLNPEVHCIKGILSQTGLSISEGDDDFYNQIIYSTVRSDLLSNLKRMKDIRVDDDITGSLVSATQIEKGNQIIDIDLKPYDVDTYILPTIDQGQKIKLSIVDLKGWGNFRGLSSPAFTSIIFNEHGDTPNIEYSNESKTISFQPLSGINYLVFSGNDFYNKDFDRFKLQIEIIP
jgi:hypothetical protein